MLVLTRKIQERIRIGPDIWITLVSISGCRAAIGVEAPRHMQVVREPANQLPVKGGPNGE